MDKKYNVIVLALRGVIARSGLDEATRKTATFACGAIVDGYYLETSPEGIRHVYVVDAKVPQLAGWIRVCEKDESNPLVSVREVVSEADKIAEALHEIAEALRQR